jgi:subtilisin-like proprotein convertase family protein
MTPTDPLYGSQWHLSLLDNTTELLIERIWNEYTGNGIHVGVYDDGIELSHTDLNDNYDPSRHIVIGGTTLSGNVTNAASNHGTSVAGLIAAENNGSDTVGVAYGASLTGINIFDATSPIYLNSELLPVQNNFYAALALGVNFDVVNHSWGSYPSFEFSQNLYNPQSFAGRVSSAYEICAVNGRGGLGTIAVQSAGNDIVEANADGINASRFTITVGAIHNDGFASSYSNYGACILVSAAGGDNFDVRNGLGVTTTDRSGVDGYNLRSNPTGALNYTDDFGGTSAAAPIVSGVVALMLDANSNLGWRDVQNILAASADHTGSAIGAALANTENNTWFINHAKNWNGGGYHFSEDYGYGRVNAFAAVRMAEAWSLFDIAQHSGNETHLSPNPFIANQIITDNATTSFQFTVAGNLLIEHVALSLTLSHDYFTDLRGFLVSPTGTEVQLVDGSTGVFDENGIDITTDVTGTWTFGIDALRGELAAGTWTLRIEDVVAGDGGYLNSVEFDAFGVLPDVSDVYHYTDEFMSMRAMNTARATLIDSNGGVDWIDAAAVTGNLILNLNAGTASTLNGAAFISVNPFSVIENAVSGDGNDIITGNAQQNVLHGMRGNDTLTGGNDNDTLNGGTGSDTLNGDAGQDVIEVDNGRAGDFDTINGGTERDLLDMTGLTNGAVWIDFGYNVISGPNMALGFNLSMAVGEARVLQMESMHGTSFNDTMRGDAGSNLIDGGAGDDTLLSYSPYDTLTPYSSLGDVMLGGIGNDLLFSGTGNDYLDGGANNDILEVGGGTDTVVTGTGSDTIFFSPRNGTDTVTDFTGGAGVVDVLKLYGFGTSLDTYAEVFAVSSQVGANTQIALTDTTIILQNFTRNTLVADDFVFV